MESFFSTFMIYILKLNYKILSRNQEITVYLIKR